MKTRILIILITMLLAACAADESQPTRKNPKFTDIQIEEDVVSIKLPATTPYFYLEKTNDDSVPYEIAIFKYVYEAGTFEFKTNLDDWRPLEPDENPLEMGMVSIAFGEEDITITYPSGTWQFP